MTIESSSLMADAFFNKNKKLPTRLGHNHYYAYAFRKSNTQRNKKTIY